ncbi:MAG: hypothetical protein PsegKO_25100 [Pseudohongiellaceae bacterium]
MQRLTNPQQEKATDRTALRSGGGLGTESSNTVPSTSNSNSPNQVLRTGVDSLYVTFQGSLSESMSARLIELKRKAQSPRESDAAFAQVTLDDHIFEVKGNGRNPYAYVLISTNFHIEVAKCDAKLLPLAYCKISSEALTRYGPAVALIELTAIVGGLGSLEGIPAVSRVDLCADFMTDRCLGHIQESEFVTKARSFDRHTVKRQFSGFSFSAGAKLSARLYDKTLEMRSKNRPRPYLEGLWLKCGWDGHQPVWRMEFQFRREAARSLSITTTQDLLSNLGGLWRYASFEWLRHTLPSDTDKTQSRWPTSDWWLTLQLADWLGDSFPVKRVDPTEPHAPSDDFLFINGLSALTSFSAREGYSDPEEAVQAFLRDARSFHDARADVVGADFDNYYRQKVENKRRLYGTAMNQPPDGKRHPGDEAVTRDLQRRAREFRKVKDGE